MTRRQTPNEPISTKTRADFGARADAGTPEGRPAATIAARFDPPHPMRVVDANHAAQPAAVSPTVAEPVLAAVVGEEAGPEASPAFVSAFAINLDDDVREQLARQANELSVHLRCEADHVDRREAQLHARLAELEQQLRTAKLCEFEQQVELESLAAALELRTQELDKRSAGIEVAERAVDAARRDVERRQAKLAADEKATIEQARVLTDRERRIAEARQQLEEHSQRVSARLVAQRDELDRHAATIKAKLARAMAVLEQRRAALDQSQARVDGRARQ